MMPKISFTTLGCPNWAWETVISEAKAMGFDGIELRGVAGELRLAKVPQFADECVADTLSELKKLGLELPCLDMSTIFHDLEHLEDAFAEAEEYAVLAKKLGSPYLRTFGDRFLPDETLEEAAVRVAAGLDRMGKAAEKEGVTVLLETHGQFASGVKIRAIMEKVTSPAVGVLWDIHHPCKYGHESMEETWDLIRPWVRHVHIKDSVGPWETHRLCNVGDGDLPIAACLRVLKRDGYDGWLSYEHEKMWHPEIAEPEAAFPVFVKEIRRLWETV